MGSDWQHAHKTAVSGSAKMLNRARMHKSLATCRSAGLEGVTRRKVSISLQVLCRTLNQSGGMTSISSLASLFGTSALSSVDPSPIPAERQVGDQPSIALPRHTSAVLH